MHQHKQDNQRGRQREQTTPLDTSKIVFEPLEAELFNTVAQQTAKVIGEDKKTNKPTQIRKFYDELCMWEEKVRQHPEKFSEYLPFILMLNAKAAYAQGRNRLVDDNFVGLMQHCLNEVKKSGKAETFTVCKLFFEAFLGFYKQERPKD
jgi:CRISPR-associated protein Csm2